MFSFLLSTHFTFFLAISISLLYFLFFAIFSLLLVCRLKSSEYWVLSAETRKNGSKTKKNSDGVNQLLNLTLLLTLEASVVDSKKIVRLEHWAVCLPHRLTEHSPSTPFRRVRGLCPTTPTVRRQRQRRQTLRPLLLQWAAKCIGVCVFVCVSKRAKLKCCFCCYSCCYILFVCISGHWWTHRSSVKHGQVIYREVRGRLDSAFEFLNLKSDISWVICRLFSKRFIFIFLFIT